MKISDFFVAAGRMEAGTNDVAMELFVNDAERPYAKGTFPVDENADPSELAIGTERNAIAHPGTESFRGEIARLLIYERPLSDQELSQMMKQMQEIYFKK